MRKLKVKNIILFILIIITLIVLGFCAFKFILKRPKKEVKINEFPMYISSEDLDVTLYDLEYNEVSSLVRGTEVIVYDIEIVNDTADETNTNKYKKIRYNNANYLVLEESLVSDKEKIIKEEILYVRTPLVLYSSSEESIINGYIKKGEELNIIGYDYLNADGTVNMYKVNYNENIGYVYKKYTVKTKEEALLNYDENGIYTIHSGRPNTYGGGSAGSADYYPYEKPTFENNVMPKEVRSLYLNRAVIQNVDAYIEFAKANNINAFVVDIKDNESPAYASKVMEKYSPTNYQYASHSIDTYKAAITKLKENGFYVIGRITTFKDYYYALDHPEHSIISTSTGNLYAHNGSYWPSPYQRKVWEFNVELAKEAVTLMGFNEIQFDYVRFPDRTYTIEANGLINMRNDYGEEKIQAIQGFVFYACDEIHKLNAYVSIDVFGESAHPYVTGYGQYFPAISNIADVISAMPYPDHFNMYEYGFNEPVWTIPYELLKYWGINYVMKRQSEISNPAIVRTWIQAYDTIRSPYIVYDSTKISEQIKGLYDAGLTGGYMTWNSGSNLLKYRSIASAFKKEYLNEQES